MALSSLISKYFEEIVECFNEINCAIFYIAYLSLFFYIAHLDVRYVYTLAFPFDLRCQSGIYVYINLHNIVYLKLILFR